MSEPTQEELDALECTLGPVIRPDGDAKGEFEAFAWQALTRYHRGLDEDTEHARHGVLAARFIRELVGAAESYWPPAVTRYRNQGAS